MSRYDGKYVSAMLMSGGLVYLGKLHDVKDNLFNIEECDFEFSKSFFRFKQFDGEINHIVIEEREILFLNTAVSAEELMTDEWRQYIEIRTPFLYIAPVNWFEKRYLILRRKTRRL